jgi:methylenetetrahydrofolate dehydrogenase (NADP+) / methenyltetrahydrofolate cyclohydrolase
MMSAKIINGKKIAAEIRSHLKAELVALQNLGVNPRLDVVLVGEHGPSQIYVKYKVKAAQEIGIDVEIHRFSSEVNASTLLETIDHLNQSNTHGILVQLPLPKHINDRQTWDIVERVNPSKDVDGLHPSNLGRIKQNSDGFIACTPQGCLHLIQTVDDISGKHAVVIGRSRIVGKPMAALLTAHNATVTLCHSRTVNLAQHIANADIVIAAAGVPHLVQGEWLKSGAIVIDVGIHRQSNGRLCGDVDFATAQYKASAITPVPGGVGPMTIASLMKNVCLSARRSLQMSTM